MAQEPRKIGLFGGSFNPVQNAHLIIARIALEKFNLDKIFFIPAAQSPFKPDIRPAPAEQRIRLLRMALAGETRFDVDTQEIERGGISYTIDTVRNYRKAYPQASLFYIIGADHIRTLPKWKAAETLAAMVEFIIFTRPNEKVAPLPEIYKIHLIDEFYFSISSTLIRKRIKEGLSIKGFVPDIVEEIIRTEKMFMQDENPSCNKNFESHRNHKNGFAVAHPSGQTCKDDNNGRNFNSCSKNTFININNEQKNEK
jgi:nicotinate-nucleotide adenylyltransferase